jgi:tetratricopeptide (TPR) repeat protein
LTPIGRRRLACVLALVPIAFAIPARAQKPVDALVSDTRATGGKPAAKTKAPSTDAEKAAALFTKRQFDQACPLFEKAAKASSENAGLWLSLGQCEVRRGHKPAAVDATRRAVVVADRVQRAAAYQLLRELGAQMEVPSLGCDWLEDTPGKCEEQLWACAYPWDHAQGELFRNSGTSITLGMPEEELDQLEEALGNGSALRGQLAFEWKALALERTDEKLCSVCHAQAIESADSLVNARASHCFQQKTGRQAPSDVCMRDDWDCDVFSNCLDEASELARRSDGAGRNLWPEASDVLSAAHKVCDATCGAVSKTRCEVLTVDACRGFVGYSCIRSERGRRPRITIGEIDVNNRKGNWSEPIVVPKAAQVSKPPTPDNAKRPTETVNR